METACQKASRLLAALDDLLLEETSLIRTMDFIEAVSVRERSAPLVEMLCTLATEPTVLRLRPRVDSLVERWSQNYHFLSEQLQRLQVELNRVTEARCRLQRVVPAYLGSSAPVESRLNTAA